MYNISEKDLKKILSETSSATVGHLLKRIEIIYKDSSLNQTQKEDCFKNVIREIIYENFRDVNSKVKCYNYGLTYEKREIYKPTDKR